LTVILTELESPVGDTRCHRGLSLRGGCGYCAVFKGRREGAGPRRSARGPTGWAPVSQNSTACSASSSAYMPRDARRRGRPQVRDGGWAGQVRSTF